MTPALVSEHGPSGNQPASAGTGGGGAESSAVADGAYSDNRELGEYKSRYPALAWLQIAGEGAYLIVILLSAGSQVLISATHPKAMMAEVATLIPAQDIGPSLVRTIQVWSVVFFSGMAGATAFAMKWLYHSVAWRKWNRDRIIWRLSVPLQGGTLATFTGAMILSGIIPLLNKEIFLRLVSAAGYGFLVGLFADNFLAALEKFAKRILGTLGQAE